MLPDRTAVWIPPDKKESVIKSVADVKKRFEAYDGGCLFAADANGKTCNEPVRNVCHTIPRGPVLMPMSDGNSGKVLEIIWGFGEFLNLFIQGSEENPVDLSDPDRFQPKLIGTGEASCGRFACKNPPIADHDGEFGPIDVANPNFADPLVAFLVQYRADLWALYQLKRVDWLMKTWGRKLLRGGDRELRIRVIETKELLRKLLPFMQDKVTRLGNIWYVNGSSANISHKVVTGQSLYFRSKLTFAACVFYGQSSVVSVFPAGGDLHQMGITNFVKDTQQDAEFTNGLLEVAKSSMQKHDYSVEVITHFSSLSSGVIDMSPGSYHNLPRTERNVINRWVQQFAQAETMAKDINSMLRNRQHRGNQGKSKRRP